MYKKGLMIGVSSLLLLNLTGCADKNDTTYEHQKETVQGLINENATAGLRYTDYTILNGVKVSSISDYMKQVQNRNVKYSDGEFVGFFEELLTIAYANALSETDLTQYLYNVKLKLEEKNQPYTKEVREYYEHNYVYELARDGLFKKFIPISNSDLSLYDNGTKNYVVVGYSSDKQTYKEDLKKVTKDLKDVSEKTFNDGHSLDTKSLDYSAYNFTDDNPIIDTELIDTLSKKKNGDVFTYYSKDDKQYTIFKLINVEDIDSMKKEYMLQTLAYTQNLADKDLKDIILEMVKIIDTESSKISFSETAYEDIENKLKNLNSTDELYFKNLALDRYLSKIYYIY